MMQDMLDEGYLGALKDELAHYESELPSYQSDAMRGIAEAIQGKGYIEDQIKRLKAKIERMESAPKRDRVHDAGAVNPMNEIISANRIIERIIRDTFKDEPRATQIVEEFTRPIPNPKPEGRS